MVPDAIRSSSVEGAESKSEEQEIVAHDDYLIHCPDCMPLPQLFPITCVSMLAAALRDPSAISDPKCVAHCALTVLAWGTGLWIKEEHDPHPAMLSLEAFSATEAADQLEAYCSQQGESNPPMMAVAAPNWRGILKVVAELLFRLLV